MIDTSWKIIHHIITTGAWYEMDFSTRYGRLPCLQFVIEFA